ncbi:hypothetical protein E2542_SST28102 [Spatholobus suberectus]|nr:hypothetical protein E2542_SST28102 [Spatholobus suberectus]
MSPSRRDATRLRAGILGNSLTHFFATGMRQIKASRASVTQSSANILPKPYPCRRRNADLHSRVDIQTPNSLLPHASWVCFELFIRLPKTLSLAFVLTIHYTADHQPSVRVEERDSPNVALQLCSSFNLRVFFV